MQLHETHAISYHGTVGEPHLFDERKGASPLSAAVGTSDCYRNSVRRSLLPQLQLRVHTYIIFACGAGGNTESLQYGRAIARSHVPHREARFLVTFRTPFRSLRTNHMIYVPALKLPFPDPPPWRIFGVYYIPTYRSRFLRLTRGSPLQLWIFFFLARSAEN
jgi:hypothetical protein